MTVLPDVLEPGLTLVFCGTAASRQSAAVGAYYAGPGNAFWPTLFEVGLTPRLIAPAEFRLLPGYGIGLTDMAKYESGVDADLSRTAFDPAGFREKVERFSPRIVAFTSKRAAQAYYDRRVDYGLQAARIGLADIWVLPSPSGAARRYWDVSRWQALADLVLALRAGA
jgi:TDG/mug DNA glycosylase family protein